MRTFGENLRELRKSRGYSQEKFAEVIGTKQVNVSAWEVGSSYYTLDFLKSYDVIKF